MHTNTLSFLVYEAATDRRAEKDKDKDDDDKGVTGLSLRKESAAGGHGHKAR